MRCAHCTGEISISYPGQDGRTYCSGYCIKQAGTTQLGMDRQTPRALLKVSDGVSTKT